MILRQLMEVFDLLDKPQARGNEVAELLKSRGDCTVTVTRVRGEKGCTDELKVLVRGINGKSTEGGSGVKAPTLGIIGRLGGLGARPEITGFVSDGDGALVVLTAALKLVEMGAKGDRLRGDVIITTHICPEAPVLPHEPVPFMNSPVDMETMNKHEVLAEMDAIISVDTTKGNRVINYKGFAISPTIKEGYILKVSDDLIAVMEVVTGRPAVIFPVSQQDITPYGNGLFHLNSILQPAAAAAVPVVGVAITTEVPVAGCATGASHAVDMEAAGRFLIEAAKKFGRNECRFYDREEYDRLVRLYGRMNRFQTGGSE